MSELPDPSGASPSDDAEDGGMTRVPVIRRTHRRATTEAVAGSDPRPAPEAARHTLTENDARLKAEKPPHY